MGCLDSDDFSTASVNPSAAFTKLGTTEHKSPPPSICVRAFVTRVSKLLPAAVNSVSKSVLILVSKVVCSEVPGVKLDKLVSNDCRLTSGRDGTSGIKSLRSVVKEVTAESRVDAKDDASDSRPATASLSKLSNLFCTELNSAFAPHKFGILILAIIILQQIH